MKTYRILNNFAEDGADGWTRVWGRCTFTGAEHECRVPTAGLRSWLAGEPIQRAMPEVSADDREFVLSGISPAGWESAFGPGEATP